MSKLILGVDAGNYNAKTAGAYGIDTYRTAICDWFQRDIVESFAEDDMEFEIDGRRGFAGTIAAYEDIYGSGGMYGDSKAHDETKIRVLLAVYRYIEKYCPGVEDVSMVVGQPIVSHKEEEKKIIREMLLGRHVFTVNGVKQRVCIHDVGVAAEGAGAFWSNPEEGTLHVLDVGSGTINGATIFQKKIINTASATFNFGIETVGEQNLESIARGIIRATTKLKWKKNALVYVCGGIANEILPFIAEHYPAARVLHPLLQDGGYVQVTDPVYANAVGFYKLAKGVFG